MTFFSSAKSWKNFAFADIDSYVKKSEKNIGAKIFALTIAVFWGNQFEVCEIYSPLIEKYKEKLKTSNWFPQKTAIVRAKIFEPIFFSDFFT